MSSQHNLFEIPGLSTAGDPHTELDVFRRGLPRGQKIAVVKIAVLDGDVDEIEPNEVLEKNITQIREGGTATIVSIERSAYTRTVLQNAGYFFESNFTDPILTSDGIVIMPSKKLKTLQQYNHRRQYKKGWNRSRTMAGALQRMVLSQNATHRSQNATNQATHQAQIKVHQQQLAALRDLINSTPSGGRPKRPTRQESNTRRASFETSNSLSSPSGGDEDGLLEEEVEDEHLSIESGDDVDDLESTSSSTSSIVSVKFDESPTTLTVDPSNVVDTRVTLLLTIDHVCSRRLQDMDIKTHTFHVKKNGTKLVTAFEFDRILTLAMENEIISSETYFNLKAINNGRTTILNPTVNDKENSGTLLRTLKNIGKPPASSVVRREFRYLVDVIANIDQPYGQITIKGIDRMELATRSVHTNRVLVNDAVRRLFSPIRKSSRPSSSTSTSGVSERSWTMASVGPPAPPPPSHPHMTHPNSQFGFSTASSGASVGLPAPAPHFQNHFGLSTAHIEPGGIAVQNIYHLHPPDKESYDKTIQSLQQLEKNNIRIHPPKNVQIKKEEHN